MRDAISTALEHFKSCVDAAPRGTYEGAKRLDEVIGEACTNVIVNVRQLGLQSDTCDLVWHVEATLYDYVKRSNPDTPMFAQAEAFGAAVLGDGREAAIAAAVAAIDPAEAPVA